MSKRKRRRSGSGPTRMVAPVSSPPPASPEREAERAGSVLEQKPWLFIAASWIGIALVLSGVFSERDVLIYAGMLLWGLASVARGLFLWKRSRLGAGLQIAAGIGLLFLVLADTIFG